MDIQAEVNIYYTILITVGIIFLFGITVIVFFIRYRRGLFQKQLIMEQRESEHRLNLLRATLETAEKERKRIAGELHDAIGSHLAVAKMSLNAIKTDKAHDKKLDALVASSKATINQTIDTVREISHDLYPPSLSQFGLKNTLLDLFEKFSDTTTINFELDCTYDFSEEESELQLTLYRITQEFVTNTIRHSNASKVQLNIYPTENGLNYIYSDNGIGLDLPKKAGKKGIGILNIESRLKAFNAGLIINSIPDKGFRAETTILQDGKNN